MLLASFKSTTTSAWNIHQVVSFILTTHGIPLPLGNNAIPVNVTKIRDDLTKATCFTNNRSLHTGDRPLPIQNVKNQTFHRHQRTAVWTHVSLKLSWPRVNHCGLWRCNHIEDSSYRIQSSRIIFNDFLFKGSLNHSTGISLFAQGILTFCKQYSRYVVLLRLLIRLSQFPNTIRKSRSGNCLWICIILMRSVSIQCPFASITMPFHRTKSGLYVLSVAGKVQGNWMASYWNCIPEFVICCARAISKPDLYLRLGAWDGKWCLAKVITKVI